MSDITVPESTTRPADTTPPPWAARSIVLGLLPLLLLAGVLALILATDGGIGERAFPPIEELNVQRVVLPESGLIQLRVINDGPDPITIAQVLVDDAYWQFEIGDRTLDRLESTTISIPYPWVQDEAHTIAIISETGVVFEAEVAVAVESPRADRGTIGRFALIGFYVGVIPVALGLLWYPFMRRLGDRGMHFILALTIGLLVFLAVDMWEEAREVALAVPHALEGSVLVPVVALLTFLLLMTIASRTQDTAERGLALAYRIAFGIGLHNLGEGLAIGAAFALGEVALGVFLIVGFTLHNVTEGVGIAAPILRERPALPHFVWLALLAGGPAILGVWIGGFVYSPLWTTIFLAIGIGAIAQVVVEVGRIIVRSAERGGQPWLNWSTFSGVTAGMAIMYATALVVAA
jgi:zinc transporter, ZIP family